MAERPPNPPEVDRAFGRVLKELRLENELSQERLGLDIGSGRTFVSELERAKRGATLKTVFRLAHGLGVSASEMVAEVEREMRRSRK